MASERPNTPFSQEAEAMVCGSVLIDPPCYTELAGFLKADDFYLHKNRWVWGAFDSLHEKGIAIDLVTVHDELERRGKLEQAGGPDYLGKLMADVPASMHAVDYGKIVLRDATARRTIETGQKIIALGQQAETPAEEMVSQAQFLTVELSAGTAASSGVAHITAAADRYIANLKERAEHPENFKGVLSGLADLDKILGGFRSPHLDIIAGRPGSGKTALMLTAALNAAKDYHKNVMIFSLEMSEAEVVERMISRLAHIPVHLLHIGAVVESDWPLIQAARRKFDELPIYIDDTSGVTPAGIRGKVARHLVTVGPLDLIIVDYLQLMMGDAGKRWDNRVVEVSYISRNLKMMAREFGAGVLAGAQLSRAVEQRQDKRPVLSDLRESGSLEQDADSVTFSHPTETPNLTDLIVGKNRHGPVGEAQVYFESETTTFFNAETREISLP